MQSNEINDRASTFDPPFVVTRQNVDRYRKSRNVEIAAIASVSETEALTSGLAIRENRVLALRRLAALMEKDLFGGFLWTEEVKGVGAGPAAEVVDYEQFNAAEVAQYRGVLDDIAKETGGRAAGHDIVKNIDLSILTLSQLQRLRDGEDVVSILANPS